jgi:hypothetical protein
MAIPMYVLTDRGTIMMVLNRQDLFVSCLFGDHKENHEALLTNWHRHRLIHTNDSNLICRQDYLRTKNLHDDAHMSFTIK